MPAPQYKQKKLKNPSLRQSARQKQNTGLASTTCELLRLHLAAACLRLLLLDEAAKRWQSRKP